MTQEEKKLLFIDICARLPYYPYVLFDLDKKFDVGLQVPIIGMVNKGNTGVIKYNQEFYAYGCMTPFGIEELRVYLRPMSSMTEEEDNKRKELGILCAIKRNGSYEKIFDGFGNESVDTQLKALDWLNAHHFDFRNLLERGLALEAPTNMYKIE